MELRSWFAPATAVVFVSLSIAACSSTSNGGPGGGDGGPEAGTGGDGDVRNDGGEGRSAEAFCDDLCARIHVCDNTRDAQTCKNQCVNANAALLPKLRTEVVALIEDCVTAKDCATVLSSTILSVCSAEAAASVAPTAAATKFCDDLVAAQNKCGRSVDRAQCLTTAKLYSDATLGDAEACTAKSCSDIGGCVTASIGDGIDAGPILPDGGGDGPKCSFVGTGTAACNTCYNSECTATRKACEQDTKCSAVLCCVAACNLADDSCVSECYSLPNDSTTVTLYNGYINCVADACYEACTM